jgi:lipopolysaccharide export system permease protein
MTLFGRYIFRQALAALAMVLVSLTAVVWIAMALKQLSLMTSDGQGSAIFLELTALILPDILTIIAPVALLIAVLHTLNRMNGGSLNP